MPLYYKGMAQFAGSRMEVLVNGESRTVRFDQTVAELLADLKLDPRHVAVEINLELAPRTAHAERKLQAGDRLEIVTFVGGG